MHVSPVNPAAPVAPPTELTAPRGGGDDTGPFSELMSRFLQEVNKPQLNASDNVQRFITGESDNINDVVLSVAKADLTFRLFMEIRNRLISSYQEIQRMQV